MVKTLLILITCLYYLGGNSQTLTCEFYYPDRICVYNNTITSTPIWDDIFVFGGTYSSDAGLSLHPYTGHIDASSSTIGFHDITYTVNSTDPVFSGSCTVTIEIVEEIIPNYIFSYPPILCQEMGTAMPTLTPGFSAGGAFYIPSGTDLVVDQTTGEIDLTASMPGVYTILYGHGGYYDICMDGGGFGVQVTLLPAVANTQFSYETPICSESEATLPQMVPGFTNGGTFSSDPNLDVNSQTGEINIQNSSLGNHTITYTVPSSVECENGGSTSFDITIEETTVANTTFSYNSPVCANIASILPTLNSGFNPGGVFTSDSQLDINPNTGEIDITASSAGLHEVYYNLDANAALCIEASQYTSTVIINQPVVPNTLFSYPATVCHLTESIFPTVTPGFDFSGQFSSELGLSLDPDTGEVNIGASNPGSYTVFYTISADPALCISQSMTSFNIEIIPAVIPSITFSYSSPVCSSAIIITPTLSNDFIGDGLFTSSTGLAINTLTGAVDVLNSPAGNHIILYSLVENESSCTSSFVTSASLIIEESGIIPTILGPSILCLGNSATFSASVAGGAWSSSDESIATIGTDGTLTTHSSGIVTISYSTDDSCASGVNKQITINLVPNPVLEDGVLCLNSAGQVVDSILLSTGIPTSGYTFQWYFNTILLPNSGNSLNALEIGTYQVIVTENSTGCSASANAVVTENEMLVGEAVVNQDFSDHQNVTVQASGGSGEYLYQLDDGMVQSSNVFYNLLNGEHVVKVIDEQGCEPLLIPIFVLDYDHYFTPNGDGINDYWKINLDPETSNVSVIIYDQYGKIIKSITSSFDNWDGTYNNMEMPADDYWFNIRFYKQNIEVEYSSHFSLKR